MKRFAKFAILASLLVLAALALAVPLSPAQTATAAPPDQASLPNWVKWHDPAAEEDPLFNKMNGTGPFKLERWTPGEEIVLVANENYWRKTAADAPWEGGPFGVAAIKRFVIREVDEWGTRFAALQAGDADNVTIDPQFWPQVDELVKEDCDYKTGKCTTVKADGILSRYKGLPQTNATDVLMNSNINTEGGNNYIGTGALDGSGIPPDFFNDVHVRKAFNYCFDWDTYIKDALQGEAEQRNGPVINPMLGYNPNGPHYSLDLNKCAEEFKASTWKTADGRSLWDAGFYMQLTYNSGNITRQTIAQILKQNIESVNPNFNIEVFALPWPVFLKERTARKLPLYTIGWLEDYHDPHNWVYPYLHSTGSYGFGVPKDLQPTLDKMVEDAAVETDQAKREQMYFDIQKFVYDNAIHMWLAQSYARRYQQSWVKGWFYNPIYCDNTTTFAYRLSKDAGAKNPDQYNYYTIGDVESLDPAYTYETFGCSVQQAVYESPLFFNRDSVTEFVPALATEWSVSDDGMTYTYKIRQGVTFHEGQTLKASDLAYAIQRGLLQDRTDGPQALLLEPIFGVHSIAELAAKQANLEEPPEKFEDLPAEGLLKACQLVQESVKADDGTGVLTIKLARPFAAWNQLMAQSWTSAISKEWAVAQGDWDGNCQ